MIDQAVLYLLWIRCLQDPKEFHRLVRKLYPEIGVDDADSIVAEYLKKQAEWRAELNSACDVIERLMEGER